MDVDETWRDCRRVATDGQLDRLAVKKKKT